MSPAGIELRPFLPEPFDKFERRSDLVALRQADEKGNRASDCSNSTKNNCEACLKHIDALLSLSPDISTKSIDAIYS